MSAYYHRNMRMHIVTLLFLFIFIIGLLFLFLGSVKAEMKQYPVSMLYHVFTTDVVVVQWDNPDPMILTEFYFWNIGEEKKYLTGSGNISQLTFTLPRTGLYVFYARFQDPTDPLLFTDWSNSLDSNVAKIKLVGQSEYIPGAWAIYGHVAPPTDGGIERSTRKGVVSAPKKK